ncbi:MAG: nitroreductase family protein [Nitrosopumilus sp.]|nr:nitroreductase family protein [Nitrosopumilus sp.]MDH3489310.1 nitroreductase family protein [Nitrosopumilus sp.]MDH3516308.1 nitroreductase family protein [Nitrosopumilus sp.]MDH3564073.1 nitroreductase family protein [Nitrosopumilus sp.]MDH5417733.1 nitroreductase family protein [Nitrosopumilus sp.]
MDTFDAINQRRSVKNFDKNYKMTKDEIDKLLELAVLSPTSYNIQNWRFVTVTDQAIKDKLSELSHGQQQVSDASLVIILCADLNSWDKEPERYWANIPLESRNALVKSIRNSYNGKPQQQRDEAMRSCGMAAQTIMLAAKSMGYDTCPMKGFDYDAVGNMINLPPDYVISMMVVVGKKTKEASARGGQLPLSDVVFENTF